MLASVHEDHVNIARLLRVLEHKLALIRGEKPVKYKLIADIISYMSHYADKYHHPKEDLIYDYYMKYRVVDGELPNRLICEHQELRELTEDLSDVLDLILLDAVMPLDVFSDKLERYIKAQWDHLNFEENEVFPVLRAQLTADDWRLIEQDWQHGHVEDPLFGQQVKEQYQALAERIRLSEA
jgi:hemerythrin-like domain-containing protein